MFFCKELTLLLALILTTSVKAEEVLELSDTDFERTVSNHELMLVMFYAPWCGHCAALKPEYSKAAELLYAHDPPITLAKVDCTDAGKGSCQMHRIPGYPTLKIFRNGKFSHDYQGSRKSADIVLYMKSQAGPNSKEISNSTDLEMFLNTKTYASVVGFFVGDSPLKVAFFEVAEKLRENVKFAHCSSQDVLEKLGALKNHIVLFRPKHLHNKYEDDEVIFKGNDSELYDFISTNQHGIVGHRKISNMQGFQIPLIIAYYSIDYARNPKGTNYWRNRVLMVAKDYSDEYNFAISSHDEFQQELKEVGLTSIDGSKPVIVAKDKDNYKYILKEFTVDTFEQFMKDLNRKQLTPFLKSAEIPINNNRAVKVVVAKNFDEMVTHNGRDTFVAFYGSRCLACHKFDEAYTKLAEKLDGEDVVFVKMDTGDNDVPKGRFDVRELPALYWLPQDGKDAPVKYNDSMEVDDMLKYVSKHATKELVGYDRQGNIKMKTEL